MQGRGAAVLCIDHPEVQALIGRVTDRRVVTYGTSAQADVRLIELEFADGGSRFSVQVVGSGPDVILVPGLASSREVWRAAVAAVPGYRYHLVQLGGFSGEPVRGNGSGRIVAGVEPNMLDGCGSMSTTISRPT